FALLAALPVSCGLGVSGLDHPSSGSSSARSSSGSGMGGDVLPSAVSATSGMGGASSVSSSSSSGGRAGGMGGAGGGGTLPATWNSWDAQTDLGNPTNMFVPDTSGNIPATLTLYQSMALNDLTIDVPLDFFRPGALADNFSRVQDIWTIPG